MNLDYDLVVIGAGSGGLAAAVRAAGYGARVAIAERAKPGGACVNYGCIPEKFLDYAAGFNRLEQVAFSYGWQECPRNFDWLKFNKAKEQHIHHLNEVHLGHIQEAGVEFLQGHASFLDAHTVMVEGYPVTAEKILISAGAKPTKPNIPGAEHAITWHELYQLSSQPRSIAVIGADPIGVKIAGSLNALGTQVTHIVSEERILSTFDAEISQEIQNRLIHRGVQFFNKTHVAAIKEERDGFSLTFAGQAESLIVETVLMDAPRTPNLENLNLDKANIQLSPSGAISINEFSQTSQESVFAVGDCTERIPLTPSAIAQGRAFADTEFGGQKRSVSLVWVPISISSHPEAATVGASEAEAHAKFGEAAVCYRTRFRPLLYSFSQIEEKTFIKAIVNRQDQDRLLGVHMVGDGAVDIIQSLAVALKLGATKQDLNAAIGIHPSSAEELFSIEAF
ncbi:FAD-dependent oxidoreductase [Pseudanabaena sp. FACHB-2040]|uniref:FAD-dependent oxidoreductase n=1 Tax=Pseudanabaena sp. FACHB-2040 TaxID=2692859 RepID=UPI001682FEA6|nr:FAD-dependent oxidoreductase [Pseudanabaena sp. FACHB-2040]MBD2259432.1 FAD-dependent oxidoreductase [Pseudanabaena sp. FACHB-2040]